MVKRSLHCSVDNRVSKSDILIFVFEIEVCPSDVSVVSRDDLKLKKTRCQGRKKKHKIYHAYALEESLP